MINKKSRIKKRTLHIYNKIPIVKMHLSYQKLNVVFHSYLSQQVILHSRHVAKSDELLHELHLAASSFLLYWWHLSLKEFFKDKDYDFIWKITFITTSKLISDKCITQFCSINKAIVVLTIRLTTAAFIENVTHYYTQITISTDS